MIEKCPRCGGNRLYIHEEMGSIYIGETGEITIYCDKCGEIGVVDIIVYATEGTFKQFEEDPR